MHGRSVLGICLTEASSSGNADTLPNLRAALSTAGSVWTEEGP